MSVDFLVCDFWSGTNTAKLDTKCLWSLGVTKMDYGSRQKVFCEECLSGWSLENERAPRRARILRPESDGEQVNSGQGRL